MAFASAEVGRLSGFGLGAVDSTAVSSIRMLSNPISLSAVLILAFALGWPVAVIVYRIKIVNSKGKGEKGQRQSPPENKPGTSPAKEKRGKVKPRPSRKKAGRFTCTHEAGKVESVLACFLPCTGHPRPTKSEYVPASVPFGQKKGPIQFR